MKKSKCANKTNFLTRAELINNSRSSQVCDKLPEKYESMFDKSPRFKHGFGEFIDVSKFGKS
jgi:hypothetical protein